MAKGFGFTVRERDVLVTCINAQKAILGRRINAEKDEVLRTRVSEMMFETDVLLNRFLTMTEFDLPVSK